MDLLTGLILIGVVLVMLVVVLSALLITKNINSRKLNMHDALLSGEKLEDHAKKTALEHSVSSPKKLLLDNFYIIEEQVKNLRRDLTKKDMRSLPVLNSGPLKGYSRIFAVAIELVGHTNGQVDEKNLADYLKAYQSHHILQDKEIWALPGVIRLALIENVRHLCEDIKQTTQQWHQADGVFNQWLDEEGEDRDRFMKSLRESLLKTEEVDSSFIEHLFYRLRRSTHSYVDVLKIMDEILIQLGTTTLSVTQKEHNAQSMNTVLMGNSFSSLRYFSSMDWTELFEAVSFVDQILRQDPDGTYPLMDLQTRNHYRNEIEEMALKHGVSELFIARQAIKLATKAYDQGLDRSDPVYLKTCHVGYYLIGKGVKDLSLVQAKKKKMRFDVVDFYTRKAGVLYLGSMILITLIFMIGAGVYAYNRTLSNQLLLAIIAGLAVMIPASEIGLASVNRLVTKTVKPYIFPKLELLEGIPTEFSTIVAIPTMLSDKKRAHQLLSNLERHYLSNREENLFFVLLGAYGDWDEANKVSDPGIINTTLEGIKKLNTLYAKEGQDIFYFFHRDRQFNNENDKWIGWERKRGALMEFNEMVIGSSQYNFANSSCEYPPFEHVRYIITLDSDSILPMGMAKKMIGAMAHPLNRPIIDPVKHIVTEGYGLLQPRIETENANQNFSVFSRIFGGIEGIDPYTNAVSDVYQDLFKEGSFTGKGIYDLQVFEEVLKNAIPENAVLSHDLLEGSYVRSGLITDVTLVDSNPTRYNAYAARLYRWVRGDWQLLPFLRNTIINGNKELIKNPLSLLSKMKMWDNLRRSLVAPSLLIYVVLMFTVLPGNGYIWILLFLFIQYFTFTVHILSEFFALRYSKIRLRSYLPVFEDLEAEALQILIAIVFIPYQAMLMLKAIVITLIRVFITGKNLLEWVTSADLERSQKNTLDSYMSKMKASFIIAPIIPLLSYFLKPKMFIASCFVMVVWISAPFVAYWISVEHEPKVESISRPDLLKLRVVARKTWRYFEEFSNSASHYLIPDNYQVDPPTGLAYRSSPTNIGLNLMSILSAKDLGYFSAFHMAQLMDKTITVMEGLDKWNGHLFNWYDTSSAKPMEPLYVSTVDSGNLAGYLITIRQALKASLDEPLIDRRMMDGIEDTLVCAGKAGQNSLAKLTANDQYMAQTLDLNKWSQLLTMLSEQEKAPLNKKPIWMMKVDVMIHRFKQELTEYRPELMLLDKCPKSNLSAQSEISLLAQLDQLNRLLSGNDSVTQLLIKHQKAKLLSAQLIEALQTSNSETSELMDWLQKLVKTLEESDLRLQNQEMFIETLIQRIGKLLDEMSFTPLYDIKKQLFSIGYNLADNKQTNSYYDLLTSEARQTSYICIARGEVLPTHWFKLGRVLTIVDRHKGLISWTGTMFEYLMPLLIMKTYKHTLLDETYSFVINSQKKYAKQRETPWGTSESGFSALGMNLEYQYKAIGIPWLGLKRGLVEDVVVAPYATFLALMVDPKGAIANLKRLSEEGLDGPYGYYEAADYTAERLTFEAKRTVVKSFMAHHQGMSLVAIDNYLNGNLMQNRFHSDPEMNAARLLLQEKVPTNLVITKSHQEKVVAAKEPRAKERTTIRTFNDPRQGLPKAHVLTNGNYSVMVTDRGTGYSKDKMIAVSRWREDRTLDPLGMFFYLKNIETGALWSSTYAPLNVLPQSYTVTFTSDRAVFQRKDGLIDTKTEVMVATGDSVEIRRITVKNNSDQPVILELTSYFEVVLAEQKTDNAHPAFSNLFIETDYNADKHCLVAIRRPRSDKEKKMWVANSVVLKEKSIGNIQIETDRNQMIGRGHDLKSPIVFSDNKPLSNTTGPVLDPIMSHRVRFKVEAGKTNEISFVCAIGENEELMMSLVDKYATVDSIEGAFRLAKVRSQMETRYLNLDSTELELYQDMVSELLYGGNSRVEHMAMLQKNTRGQSALWKYGISGDRAQVLVVLNKTSMTQILNEVLKAHDYWRLMDLKVDLIILSDEDYSYANPLYQIIVDIVQSSMTSENPNHVRDIFILDRNKVQSEDIPLLYASSRVILIGDGRTMKEQVSQLEQEPLQLIKPQFKALVQYEQPQFKVPNLVLDNGLGGFNPEGNEYIIHLEKGQNTPAPWINVIANPIFGFLISESGSSTTWADNSHESKLTPWSNDAVSDTPGEILYLHDDETNETWTTTALPIREEEGYLVTHGFGYSIFEHTSHGIKQRSTVFVPTSESIKLNIMNLKNVSDQKRSLSLTFVIKPILGDSDQNNHLMVKARLIDQNILILENPQNVSFDGKKVFIDVSSTLRSWSTDRNEFFGFGGLISPDCLSESQLSNNIGAGFDMCGALQVKVTLDPNESKEIIFMMGIATTDEEAIDLCHNYRKEGKATESYTLVKSFWKDKLSQVQVVTPSMSMDLLLNGWLQYQTIACRLWARSGFYQSGGATGFRDQLQDSLSIAHFWPELSRKQILLHAAHQYLEGDVQHWWHDPQGVGVRTRISDDLLWLPYVSCEYNRISGDNSIWEENLGFISGPVLSDAEDDRYSQPEVSHIKATLYHHCVLAIEKASHFGPHGLPLMGSGDWNDGMNRVGHKGKGESIWLAWFLITVLGQFIPICTQQADHIRAQKYEQIRKQLIISVEHDGWDGKWYRRAYFDNGQVLGSNQNAECKIDSIAQSWAVISKAGDPLRAQQALKSLEDYLVDKENGLIKLLTPPFNSDEFEPGYIKGYLPGVRENGGQYTHAAAWAIIAFAQMGQGNKALENYDLINPINHTGNFRDYSRYKVEPYVMAADVYSVYPHNGKGGWTWYTGSSGWMIRAGLENILGFRKNGLSLFIDPCIPTYWDSYMMTYKHKSATYIVKVENPAGLNKGVRKIFVDGKLIAGHQIQLSDDGKTHEVSIIMGHSRLSA
ncbi:MAG: cellobiose phosphorylase [Erysipelotrichaceae bacterium]|nr:MAG: cellobiose phosphorylase [Erysipelotrichaceae bacterium]